MSLESKNKQPLEEAMLKLILLIIIVVSGVLFFSLNASKEIPNTQLGSLVDQDNLPVYKSDQDFSKRKYFGVVRVIDSRTFKGFCSAFIISDDYAISAAHCFHDSQGKLKDKEYKISTDKVVDQDTALESTLITTVHVVGITLSADYALLKGNFKEITHMRVNTGPFVMEQVVNRSPLPGLVIPLYALGFPNGLREGAGYMQMNCVQIADYIGCAGGMFHGLSGGPLFDPISKEVLAVNHAIGTQGDTYFKPIMGIFENFNIQVE